MKIKKALKQRGMNYGNFRTQAKISQNIKQAFKNSPNWAILTDDKKECLDMIANKLGRILNGDPDFKDSWFDIIGYTKLIEKDL